MRQYQKTKALKRQSINGLKYRILDVGGFQGILKKLLKYFVKYINGILKRARYSDFQVFRSNVYVGNKSWMYTPVHMKDYLNLNDYTIEKLLELLRFTITI